MEQTGTNALYEHFDRAEAEEWKRIREAASGIRFGKITITFQNGKMIVWEKSESRRVGSSGIE